MAIKNVTNCVYCRESLYLFRFLGSYYSVKYMEMCAVGKRTEVGVVVVIFYDVIQSGIFHKDENNFHAPCFALPFVHWHPRNIAHVPLRAVFMKFCDVINNWLLFNMFALGISRIIIIIKYLKIVVVRPCVETFRIDIGTNVHVCVNVFKNMCWYAIRKMHNNK